MKTKILTISELTRPATNYRGITMAPIIRISGNWLHDAGFKPGDHIRVEIEHDHLIISKLSLPGATELRTETNNQSRKDRS